MSNQARTGIDESLGFETGGVGDEEIVDGLPVLADVRRRSLPEPNIEFALAVLADVAGMVRGAGEAIFAISRTAGWLAHALEEYERNIPIRPRGVYVGLAATDSAGVLR